MKLLTNTEQLVTKCAILHVDNGSFWTVNLISVGTTHGRQYPRWQHVKATYHTDTAPVSGGDVRKLSANYFFFGFVWFTSIFERLCMRVTLRVCLREWVFIFGIKKASMFFFVLCDGATSVSHRKPRKQIVRARPLAETRADQWLKISFECGYEWTCNEIYYLRQWIIGWLAVG